MEVTVLGLVHLSGYLVLPDLLTRPEDRAVGTWGENPDVPHGHTIDISYAPILPQRYYYTPPILYHSPAAVLHPARIAQEKDAWRIFPLPATAHTLLWTQRHHQRHTYTTDTIIRTDSTPPILLYSSDIIPLASGGSTPC